MKTILPLSGWVTGVERGGGNGGVCMGDGWEGWWASIGSIVKASRRTVLLDQYQMHHTARSLWEVNWYFGGRFKTAWNVAPGGGGRLGILSPSQTLFVLWRARIKQRVKWCYSYYDCDDDDCWCLPPVWNLRAVIWFHLAISSLILLPSPFTLSVLSFSACWPFLLNFFQKILQYFLLRDRLFCMAPV